MNNQVSGSRPPLILPTASFVYEAVVEIGAVEPLGVSPLGERRIVAILGGQFEGPKIRGTVRPGGSDRQLVGSDGVRRLDALYELETYDGAVITVRNRVRLDGAGYARSWVELTAPLGRYEWLNQRVFVGSLDSLAPQPQVLIRVFVID
jgi:Protein of unknown function (DUF3237)